MMKQIALRMNGFVVQRLKCFEDIYSFGILSKAEKRISDAMILLNADKIGNTRYLFCARVSFREHIRDRIGNYLFQNNSKYRSEIDI